MPRIRIQRVGQGQHPSEVMISVNTPNGLERLIVDKRSLQDDTLDIGCPVGDQDDYILVELPRETMSGEWRVLVPRSILVKEAVT